jgi:hypothetical protein
MGAPMAPTVAHARMAANWSGNRPTNAGWNPLRPGRVQAVGMQNEKVVDTWRTRGFVILPAFLSAEDIAPALGELEAMFPTSEGFHDGTDPRCTRYVEDEFDGIDVFPFASTEFSLLAVHPRIVQLAEDLLGQPDLQIFSAEAWAKYPVPRRTTRICIATTSTRQSSSLRQRTGTRNWNYSSSSSTSPRNSARHIWFRGTTPPPRR